MKYKGSQLLSKSSVCQMSQPEGEGKDSFFGGKQMGEPNYSKGQKKGFPQKGHLGSRDLERADKVRSSEIKADFCVDGTKKSVPSTSSRSIDSKERKFMITSILSPFATAVYNSTSFLLTDKVFSKLRPHMVL